VPALAGLVRAKWLGWARRRVRRPGLRDRDRLASSSPGAACCPDRSLGSSRRPWCGLPGAAASTTPMATTFTTAPVATTAVGPA